MARSGTRLLLVRWRTASWWRRARISTCSEVRVRRVEASPASSDISTALMARDGSRREAATATISVTTRFLVGTASAASCAVPRTASSAAASAASRARGASCTRAGWCASPILRPGPNSDGPRSSLVILHPSVDWRIVPARPGTDRTLALRRRSRVPRGRTCRAT